MDSPEASIRTDLGDGDVVLSVRERTAAPDHLQAAGQARIVVEVDGVRYGIVEGEEADAPVRGAFGEVDCGDPGEGEGDGRIGRVRVGWKRALSAQAQVSVGLCGLYPTLIKALSGVGTPSAGICIVGTRVSPSDFNRFGTARNVQVSWVESDEILCMTAPVMAPSTVRGANASRGTDDAAHLAGNHSLGRGMAGP